MLKPIEHLGQLRRPEYAELVKLAARNMGIMPGQDPIRWLELNAEETDEQGVVDEVNYCLDMLNEDNDLLGV